VAPIVRDTIYDYVDHQKETEVIAIGRNSVEPEKGITILIAMAGSLSPKFEGELTQAINTARGEDTELRIFTLLMAPIRHQ
jgi:hypothetical protein